MVIRVADYPKHSIKILTANQPDLKEQVAYDLHGGPSYRRPGDANRHEMPEELTLRPNDCVRIDTEEQLQIPGGVFGQICSRASLTAEGLIVANLKIDPNFRGMLNVTIFNTSRRPIQISRGRSFCSVFFFTLENGLPPDSAIRVPPDPAILKGAHYKELLLRVAPYAVTFGASVAASLLAENIFRWYSGGRH